MSVPSNETSHIVIVEDDDMLADFLTKRLNVAGFECTRYANGSDALVGILAEPAVDLILLDISLPDMDGFEVLQQIQKDPRAAEIPVIIASNFSQEKDIQWGERLGVKKFLNKASMLPSEIVDVVTETIQKNRTAKN